MSAPSSKRRIAAACLTAFAVVAGILPASPAIAPPLPAHVFAPYFETWSTDTISGIAQQSGARYFTLAFLETLSKTSCTLAWNGESGRTVASNAYVDDIAALRAL